MSAAFEALAKQMARDMADDYGVAFASAQRRNPNKAGHEGEASWASLLKKWFPRHHVVTRKYIVGPGGGTNEIDLLVLKPDYPEYLHDRSDVLISGVAAAFSCKTTLRDGHIEEALVQKRKLLGAAGFDYFLDGADDLHPETDPSDSIRRQQPSTVHEALRGPIPFGLLAHSSALALGDVDFRQTLSQHYRDVAYAGPEPRVNHPQKELDAVLVADSGFFRTLRVSYLQNEDASRAGGPMSVFSQNGNLLGLEGAELVQFLMWLSGAVSQDDTHALQTMEPLLAPPNGFGYFHPWPLDVYPPHVRQDPTALQRPDGQPYSFMH